MAATRRKPQTRRKPAPRKPAPRRRASGGMTAAKADELAKTAAVVGAVGYFAITKVVEMRAASVAKGETPKIPEAVVKGYGPAALVAAAAFFMAGREKNGYRAAGIKAGGFAAAAALAIANYQATNAAAAGLPQSPQGAGRLLAYQPQAAGRFYAAGEHGAPSQNINSRPARRVRIAS